MAVKQIGAAPSGATDAVTKGYVDTAIGIHDGMITAVDHGALAWTNDPQVTGTFTPTAGSAYATLFRAAASGTCANVKMQVTTLGSPTLAYVGIFDMSGNQLAISADQHTLFTTTGAKTIPLASTVALVAGTTYALGFVNSGGTSPVIVCSIGASSPSLGQTLSNTTPLRQMKTTSTTRTTFTNPEVWTGYAVVGNSPLALMTV